MPDRGPLRAYRENPRALAAIAAATAVLILLAAFAFHAVADSLRGAEVAAALAAAVMVGTGLLYAWRDL